MDLFTLNNYFVLVQLLIQSHNLSLKVVFLIHSFMVNTVTVFKACNIYWELRIAVEMDNLLMFLNPDQVLQVNPHRMKRK